MRSFTRFALVLSLSTASCLSAAGALAQPRPLARLPKPIGQVAAPAGKLSAPFRYPEAFSGPIGFDHDRTQRGDKKECQSCRGQGFPECYDQHEGSDFMLLGWFPAQDIALYSDIIAAAPGRVLLVTKDREDHCFADPNAPGGNEIRCPTAENNVLEANLILIAQDDGMIASYYHLKKGSVVVNAGDHVSTGQLLGKAGSSGISSAPHLHFQLAVVSGSDTTNIDPYCTPSGENLWAVLDSRRVPQIPGRPVVAPASLNLALPEFVREHPDGNCLRTTCLHPPVQQHPGQFHETGVRVPCTGHRPNPNHRHFATAPCAHLVSPHPEGDVVPGPCPHIRPRT